MHLKSHAFAVQVSALLIRISESAARPQISALQRRRHVV